MSLDLLPAPEVFSERAIIALWGFGLHMLLMSQMQRQAVPDALKPVYWLDRFLDAYERKLNRPNRSYGDRLARGALVTLPLLYLAWWAGMQLEPVGQSFSYGWVVEAAILAIIIPWRLAFDVAWKLTAHGHDMSLYECRKLLATATPYTTDALDQSGVYRHAIERLALGFADMLVGVVLWYLLLGLPGAALYMVAGFMMQRIGHTHPEYQAFGLPLVGIFSIMHVPVLVVAGLLTVAGGCFAPATHPAKAVAMVSPALRHEWLWLPVWIMAGLTNTQLGGARRAGAYMLDLPWMGDGNAKAGDADVRGALRVIHVASLLLAGGLMLLYVRLG